MSSSERLVSLHVVRARERWLLAIAALLFGPALALGLLFVFAPITVVLMIMGGAQWLLFFLGLGIFASWKRLQQLEVEPVPRLGRASSEGLFVDGGPMLPRQTITGAYVSPSWPNGAYVRLHRKGAWTSEFWTADVDGAHELVAALGLDEQHAVGVVRGAPWLVDISHRVVAFAVMVGLSIGLTVLKPVLAVLIPVLLLLWMALALVPVQHVVGNDGVVTRWLGRRGRFVPIGAIVSVEAAPGRVVLELDDGTTRELWIAHHIGGAAAVIGLQVSLLADRIRGAMRRAGTLEVDASALERGGRDVGAWIGALRELSRGTGYRAAVQREDLVFLVEDARRPPEVRVAAAIALGAADPHERARLRIAADSSSIPEVREALEATLLADDERVTQAVARLESAKD